MNDLKDFMERKYMPCACGHTASDNLPDGSIRCEKCGLIFTENPKKYKNKPTCSKVEVREFGDQTQETNNKPLNWMFSNSNNIVENNDKLIFNGTSIVKHVNKVSYYSTKHIVENNPTIVFRAKIEDFISVSGEYQLSMYITISSTCYRSPWFHFKTLNEAKEFAYLRYKELDNI